MQLKGIVTTKLNGDKRVGYNAITQLGKDYFAAMALRQYSLQGISEVDSSFVQSRFYQPAAQTTTQYMRRPMCVYLLNLTTTEIQNLAASNHLPILNGDGTINTSKVVARGTQATTPSPGVGARQNKAFTDFQGAGQTWRFENIAGTYNVVAIGADVYADTYNSISVHRGVALSQNIMLPGISGATTDVEILTSKDHTTRLLTQRVNLATGEVTPLTADDNHYNMDMVGSIDTPQLVWGGKLVYSYGSMLYAYDLTTKQTATLQSWPYGFGGTLFTWDGHLYVRDYDSDFVAYDSGFNRLPAKDKGWRDLVLPPEFSTSARYTSIVNYGADYLVTRTDTTDTYNQVCVVMANPFDPNSIKAKGRLMGGSVANFGGVPVHFAANVTDDITTNIATAVEPADTYYGTRGVKMCRSWGNMLSYYVEPTPVTVKSTDVLYIDYRYSFV